MAVVVKPADQGDEADKYDDLDDERGFEEGETHALFPLGDFDVGPVADAVAVEGLNEGGEAAEGGEDAAWVEGGVVGDVVEEAAEDLVVAHFVEGAFPGKSDFKASDELEEKSGDLRHGVNYGH